MKHKWPITKLGEVLTERRETPTDDDLATGRVRIIEKISFDSGRIQLRVGVSTKTGMIRVRPGDLVVSGINAAKGAIAIYDANETAPVAATIHYGAYETNRQRADVRFLWWMLRSHFFQELLREYVPGGIKTELKAKRLLPVPVPLPPLAEQRWVVARIEELAAQIHEVRTLRHQAAEEADALTISASRSLFGEMPKKNWAPLNHFVSEIENGKSPQCESSPASIDEWGVLKVGAISFGSFDEQENKALPIGMTPNPKYEVRPGDFLMSRANTTELVGACAIVGQTRPRLLLSDKTFRFHFQRNAEVEPHWLDYAMKSPALREQIERGATGTSPTMKNISKQKVMELLLPPHTQSEQRRIVAELDALQTEVDALKGLQAETAAELDALLPAILDKAFRGEL